MAIYSNGTSIANAGTVLGSAANLSSIPAPTDAQILAGVAQTEEEVGSYAFLLNGTSGPYSLLDNSTLAGSSLRPAGAATSGTPPYDDYTSGGTWRCKGYHDESFIITVWLRYV